MNTKAGRTNLLEVRNIAASGKVRGGMEKEARVGVSMPVVIFYFLTWLVVTWGLFTVIAGSFRDGPHTYPHLLVFTLLCNPPLPLICGMNSLTCFSQTELMECHFWA